MPYQRKTTDIFISDEIKSILEEIESESLVAHLLLKKRHSNENIAEDNVNYISLSKQDKRRISYMTSDRMELVPEEEYWTSSKRYHAKPGSFVSKVFKGIPAKEVEKFSTLFRTEADKPEFTFKVVKGEDIRKWYYYESYASQERGTLGISCMKHEHCQSYLDIYTENPDQVSMLIMLNPEGYLIGRAILWDFESYKIMDRIYTICDEEYSLHFKKWCIKNGYLHKSEQNWYNTLNFEQFGNKKVQMKLEISLPNAIHDHYPYMDTFKFIDNDGKLYNYHPDNVGFKTMCATDGRRQNSDFLRFDSISKVFRYPGDCVWLGYISIYTHHDNCYYSESNDQYILRADCVYNEEARDYIFNEENDSHNNHERIKDRIKNFKERNNRKKSNSPWGNSGLFSEFNEYVTHVIRETRVNREAEPIEDEPVNEPVGEIGVDLETEVNEVNPQSEGRTVRFSTSRQRGEWISYMTEIINTTSSRLSGLSEQAPVDEQAPQQVYYDGPIDSNTGEIVNESNLSEDEINDILADL